MQRLPHHLYRARQVRELDRLAIEECGMAASDLMERAGAEAFAALQWRWPDGRRVAVVCGGGNNGGDGYVIARLAAAAGIAVDVFSAVDPAGLQGAAAAAAQAWRASGGQVRTAGTAFEGYDVIVDALLGTGLDREVTGPFRAAIDAINDSGAAVLAVDVPSGLHADSGRILGAAARADLTVTFIGLKQGLFTGRGPDVVGAIHYSRLGVPDELFSRIGPAAMRLSFDALSPLLAARRRASHKGNFGHVLIVGGDHGMMGAALLAGTAAARAGAGLVSVATRAAHAPLLSVARPELMSHGVERPSDLHPLLERATVVVIGPGLGRSEWARGLVGYLFDASRPLVVDADALNLLARDEARRDDWILTPHPGEAARLLGTEIVDVETDRFAAVNALQRRYGGVALLKGAGTLVCGADGLIGVCASGNPGMATGGMGDVLSGLIGGLAAQGIDLVDAAGLGALVHAGAGDRAAAAGGERGLIASDLLERLRPLLNPPPAR